MAYSTFDWNLHIETTVYNDVDQSLKLGGGWDYMIDPLVNPPRTFVLTFGALCWFTKRVNDQLMLDYETSAPINAGRLDKFFDTHRLHKPFWYPHPKYGLIKVRFDKPVNLANPSLNSKGVVQNVTVFLKEML